MSDSVRPHRRHYGVQGRRGLRFREAARGGARPGGDQLGSAAERLTARLGGARLQPSMPADAAPTLVIQTAFLGDVVLTTPLLAELAERHGPVDVVTTPAAAPLLDTHPAVRQVLVYDKRKADR